MEKKIKVIYAEDDALTAEVMIYKMKKAGFEVIYFSDGEGVFEAILNEKPNVILLDLMLPKKSGYSILKDIKSHPELSNIAVIIFSALDHTKEYTSLAYHYADYILKPCSPDVIVPRILNAVQ